MNKLINIILISTLALSVACRGKHISPEQNTFEPAPQLIGTQTEGTKAEENPTTTNTYTDLSAVANMGLYVVSEKLTLQPAGNTYDNVQCVNTAGKFAPSKNLYYPSEQFGVKLKAYIPYAASLADPSAIPVSVKADQSTSANVKASDFLFGSTSAVSPGVQKVPVELKHAMTLLHLAVEVPARFMDRTVTGCTGAVIMNSPTAGVANLSPDIPTVTANYATKTTIAPIQISKTGTNPMIYTFEAVVLPHAIAAGASMFALELTFGDALGNEVFVYQPKDAMTLTSGGWHTLKLKVADYGKLTLSSAAILPWTTEEINGTLSGMGVANTFKFTILSPQSLPSQKLYTDGYVNGVYTFTSKVNGVRLNIIPEQSYATASDYVLTTAENDITSTSQLMMLKADFGLSTPGDYEFRINRVEFFSDAACATTALASFNISQTVTGGGSIPLVLYPNKGVGGGWNPGGWTVPGTIDGIYDKNDINNTVKLVYYNAKATVADKASFATKFEMYTGTTTKVLAYTVTTGVMTVNPHDDGVFTSEMTTYATPKAETAPTEYPFTITQIKIYTTNPTTTTTTTHTINAVANEWQVQGQGPVAVFVTEK